MMGRGDHILDLEIFAPVGRGYFLLYRFLVDGKKFSALGVGFRFGRMPNALNSLILSELCFSAVSWHTMRNRYLGDEPKGLNMSMINIFSSCDVCLLVDLFIPSKKK